jgi:hypothetical protein
MSNQQKAGFIGDIFVYNFLGGTWQNFAKNLICIGRSILLRNLNSATGRVSDIRNSKIANRLGPFGGPSES